MARRSLRQKPRINYYEPEEPAFDEYLFCEECSDYVFEYCAIHGPLLVIPDDKVPPKPKYPPVVPRAALTIPHVFLHLAPSIIPGAGIGVFSTLTVPQGVRFGPYRGLRADEVHSMYCWQIYDRNNKRLHVVDAADSQRSNWMRYVNCARHWTEQNLVAYQYKGELYYRTIKIIPRFTELLVFYGSEFANLLNINVIKYNSPEYYSEVISSYQVAVPETNSTTNSIEESVLDSRNPQIEDNTQDSEELINFDDFKVIDKNIDNTQTISVTESLDENTITVNFAATQENKNITNDSKFQCNICEKSYFHKKSLKAHTQIHTGPIYKCSKCSYTTSIAYCLKRHINRHVTRKCFSCDYCPFQTELQQTYIMHSVEHNNSELTKLNTGSYYPKLKHCNLCDFKTYSRKSFQTHKLKHQGVVYKCELCDYSNYSKINYANHYIRKHGK